MSISLFVPVYNEEEILQKNIEEIYKFFTLQKYNFEIVIVDDSSKDSTSVIGKALAKKHKSIRYLRFDNGPSRRENLGEAMKSAKYEFVGYMDLDLAVPLLFFPKLLESLKQGADVALGSRRVAQAKVKRSIYRLAWSTLYHKTLQTLFNSKIRDYQCGFKIFKKKVLVESLKKIGYDSGFQRGWFWDAELLLAAERQNFKLKEIPVSWREGAKSSFNLIRELKVIPYILKLRLQKF
jgi:glycosyltransferase involved in cell wall biosynthesis